MKFTETDEKQMRESFGKMDAMGCVPVTERVGGSGRLTEPEAPPPSVERLEREEHAKTALPKHDTPERTAYEFFRADPRRKAVPAMDREAATAFPFDSAHGNEFQSKAPGNGGLPYRELPPKKSPGRLPFS